MKTYEKELLTEVAKLVQRKYGHLNETLRLTKEMSQELSRDDKVTVQMLLAMRGEELDAIRNCDASINMLMEGADGIFEQGIKYLLKGEMPEIFEGETLAQTISNVVQNMKNVHRQTIEVDKRMSCRLAGEDSFYNQ